MNKSHKFTAPEFAEDGHLWETVSGQPAIHASGSSWLIREDEGMWYMHNYDESGWCYDDNATDTLRDKSLVMKDELWVNMYSHNKVAFTSKESAAFYAERNCLARVKVSLSWKEGQFDD